ncbi:Holliday junction resolvase RecU [Lederbergia panacisoli]|uniref:Holliday junction resolvase RecU n=1 Tax=Lederbergia panacisoli TaxID=1255251 RepID=UPI00214BF81E|nr:Holliday junction resolvase RecU [Lederbergia panacisoli]MCR2820206.1 Holliday junction resolvase RecU [Lederbergia panacisoli]
MEFHYPNGKKYRREPSPQKSNNKEKIISYSKRGMTLEEDLNETNLYYLSKGMAVIHKKPTPIQIVQVDYQSRSTAVIKEAYFRQASTTDYNGVYKGKYIDFEAKETQSNTSFPLRNFHEHQINHMKNVVSHNGIAFVILRFVNADEVFLLESKDLFSFWDRMESGGRKSIKREEIISCGHRIEYGLHPRIDYLKVIQQLLLI